MTASKGYLRGLFDEFMDRRRRESEIYMSRMLLACDNSTLWRHGFNRADLERRASQRLDG